MASKRKKVSTAPPSVKKDPEYYTQFFEDNKLPVEFQEPVHEEYKPKQIKFPRPSHEIDPQVYDVPIRDRRLTWKDGLVIMLILSIPLSLTALKYWDNIKVLLNGSL